MNNSMDKPRKPCVAALLSLLSCGLGHVYAGELKRGILFYLGRGLLLAILLFLLFIRPDRLGLLVALVASIVYFLFYFFDSVRAAKKSSASYEMRKFNKWYFYLFYLFLANIVLQSLAGALVKEHFIKAYKIPAGSMLPTLLVGDHLLVNRFIYKQRQPERGDIVVFEYPRDPSLDYIKRIVAVAGDVVELRDKRLFVDGVPQDAYPTVHKDNTIHPRSEDPRDNFGPVTVPEHAVFVLGDNRDNSFDSRFWGFVDESTIKGKAMSFYWSWDLKEPLLSARRWSSIRWDRIGKEIQ
ncbi:MAG: signal peptidase I [Candidatus Electrothrix scaldis]|nr:MAG: signal peptidase I [Candidatus Electrothrix sp. GW3-3]